MHQTRFTSPCRRISRRVLSHLAHYLRALQSFARFGINCSRAVHLRSGQERKGPREPTEERGIGAIYLSEDIASLFTDAVRKELQFSGYTLDRGASLTLGGVIDRFSYDWVGLLTQRVDVAVSFQVRRGGEVVYSRNLSSHKEAPKTPGYETEAIKSAMSDCIQQFLEDAHNRRAL